MKTKKINLKNVVILVGLLIIIFLCNVSIVYADDNSPTNYSVIANNNSTYTNDRYITLDLYAEDMDKMEVWVSNDGTTGAVLDFEYNKTITITDENYVVGTPLDSTNSETSTNTDNIFRIVNWPLSSINGEKDISAVFRDSYGNRTPVEGLTTINITYDLNGETVTTMPDLVTTVRGLGVYIPSLELTDINKTFKGWSPSKTATLASYTAGTFESFNNDTILYAVCYTIPTGTIKITGENIYSETLSVDTSNVYPNDCTFEYQWYYNDTTSLVNGTPITNATNSTYTIEKGLIDKYIYVIANAKGAKFENATFKDITDSYNNSNATVKRKILVKPTLEERTFKYDGTEKTPIINGYNSSLMTASGKLSSTNAGRFSIKIDLNDTQNYIWADGSTNYFSLSWEISKISLQRLSLNQSTYTYDGTQKSPTINGLDSNLMEISGTTSATNAGEYNIEATLKDSTNYTWINNTNSYINIEWQINKVSLTKPTASTTSYYYTGSNINLGLSGYDSSKMSITGNSATASGNYTATINLKDTTNYCWADGTTNSVTINWSIKPQTTVWNIGQKYSWKWDNDNPTYWEDYYVIDTRDYTNISKVVIDFYGSDDIDVDMGDYPYDRQSDIEIRITSSDPWAPAAIGSIFDTSTWSGTTTINTSGLSGTHKMYIWFHSVGRYVETTIEKITFYY